MIFTTTMSSSEEPEEQPVETSKCDKWLWHQQMAVKRFHDRIL